KFGDFVLGSNWQHAVGDEYGIGPGTHVKKVALPDALGPTMSTAQLETLLGSHILDGSLPAPAGDPNELLYMVYLPSTTVIADNFIGTLCTDFVGFHRPLYYQGVTPVAYALVGDCGTGPDDIPSTASH